MGAPSLHLGICFLLTLFFLVPASPKLSCGGPVTLRPCREALGLTLGCLPFLPSGLSTSVIHPPPPHPLQTQPRSHSGLGRGAPLAPPFPSGLAGGKVNILGAYCG